MIPFYAQIENDYINAPRLKAKGGKFIIFSDFHLGKRNKRDDFKKNSDLMLSILKEYYLKLGYTLILNGDIEELQKHRVGAVMQRWRDLYDIFDLFLSSNRFYKLVGNHDHNLFKHSFSDSVNADLLTGLVLEYGVDNLFIFHGHQASHYNGYRNLLIGFILRYLANPLGIRNIVRDYGNLKVHKMEERVYRFSKEKAIVSIIGHTHRALFESMSDIDLIMVSIEGLLRKYISVPKRKRQRIENQILELRDQLAKILKSDSMEGAIGSTYNKEMIIPSIFNSGCVIGQKSMTGIEIENGDIALIRWYNEEQRKKYYPDEESTKYVYNNRSCYRKVLKQDSLDYIFTRMKLLTK